MYTNKKINSVFVFDKVLVLVLGVLGDCRAVANSAVIESRLRFNLTLSTHNRVLYNTA